MTRETRVLRIHINHKQAVRVLAHFQHPDHLIKNIYGSFLCENFRQASNFKKYDILPRYLLIQYLDMKVILFTLRILHLSATKRSIIFAKKICYIITNKIESVSQPSFRQFDIVISCFRDNQVWNHTWWFQTLWRIIEWNQVYLQDNFFDRMKFINSNCTVLERPDYHRVWLIKSFVQLQVNA